MAQIKYLINTAFIMKNMFIKNSVGSLTDFH